MPGYRLPLLGVVCCASLLTQATVLAADVPERGKAPLGPAQVSPGAAAEPPAAVPAPAATPSNQLVTVPAGNAAQAGGPKVMVRQLQIKGNTRFE